MCLLNFLKPKTKKQAAPKESKSNHPSDRRSNKERTNSVLFTASPDRPDEEYQLPLLAKGTFTMTEELHRRQQEELLKKKYGISFPKEGSFI